MIWSGLGFVFFIIVFFMFGAPVKTYVLEHELSHILVAMMSGTKIRRVSFHTGNAYVRTDRVNLFIALGPYSLPLYTLFVILVLKLIQQFTHALPVMGILYFIAGLTLSFHFVATMHYLQLEQPDTQRYGSFASLIFVTTWALIILVLVLALMFEDVQVLLFFRESIGEAGVIYRHIAKHLYDMFHRIYVFFLTI
jgi:hypothetical protein